MIEDEEVYSHPELPSKPGPYRDSKLPDDHVHRSQVESAAAQVELPLNEGNDSRSEV